MTDSDPCRSEPENHVRKPREIPKILFLNLQAFQAKSPKSCRTGCFKISKTSRKSTPPGVSHRKLLGIPVHCRVTPPRWPTIRFLFARSGYRLRLPSDPC